MGYQASSGCGGCAHASSSMQGSRIQRGLSQTQYDALRDSGFSYYCWTFNTNVETDRGKTCGSWKSDDPGMS